MRKKLNPKFEEIPGLRFASEEEKFWISSSWSEHLKRGVIKRPGRVPGAASVFFFLTGIPHLFMKNYISVVFLLSIACGLLVISIFSKKWSDDYIQMVEDVISGNYKVVQAIALSVTTGDSQNYYYSKIRLFDGRVLTGLYEFCPEFAGEVMKRGIKNLPVLLVMVSSGKIFVIPVREVYSNIVKN